jgi:hypothetical protein
MTQDRAPIPKAIATVQKFFMMVTDSRRLPKEMKRFMNFGAEAFGSNLGCPRICREESSWVGVRATNQATYFAD